MIGTQSARRSGRSPLARTGFALAALVLSAILGTRSIFAQASTERPAPNVLVVPVQGVIGVPTVALARRALREAKALAVSWVLLEIDTPGGLVTSTREVEAILQGIRDSGIRTVAYVRRQALSAGGYLALACAETYMGPAASIGAITPVQFGPGGVQEIPDTDVRRKMYSALRADVRALLEVRDARPETLLVVEAMVDPTMRIFEVGYEDAQGADVVRIMSGNQLDELAASGATIRNQRELGSTPLTLTSAEAIRFGISSGTFDSVEDLVQQVLGTSSDQISRLEESWSESAVEWLESMKLLLFVLGFVLLLLEMKSPGFAVPGALGVLLLGLGMFSSYLVGLAEWTEILLFFLGIVLIGVEIFVIPGTIIAGAAGFVALVAALILSQQSFVYPSNDAQVAILEGNLLNLLQLLVLVLICTALLYKFLPHIPLLNRLLLVPPSESRTGDANMYGGGTLRETEGAAKLRGVRGVAATDLRPAGRVELADGAVLDVVAEGGFVERGVSVQIVEVAGNRVVVAPIEPSDGFAERGEASIALLVLLLVVGLCLIIAEVFFVSMGILSVGAAIALVSAVFLAFTHHGQAVGFGFLAACAVGAPLAVFWALRILPRTGLGRALLLAGPEREQVVAAAEEPGLRELVGKSGQAISDLRPAGYAKIDGKRVDVVTRGEMIESGAAIEVIAADGNRVVVAEPRGSRGVLLS